MHLLGTGRSSGLHGNSDKVGSQSEQGHLCQQLQQEGVRHCLEPSLTDLEEDLTRNFSKESFASSKHVQLPVCFLAALLAT